MAFAAFPPAEIRPTALALNVVAAGYATWRLHAAKAIDWPLLRWLAVPSLPAALLESSVVLGGRTYLMLTGSLLLLAAVLLLARSRLDAAQGPEVDRGHAAAIGAVTGFLSGLTGVGGGVFLAPLLIGLGWTSPRRAAGLSAPFILVNSAVALAGVTMAGQSMAHGTALYALFALAGAVAGTAVGLRWISQAATRYLIAGILALAGTRLILA
ncbi:brp/Blh family beta-carotene 15,15'-monooxygenase [Methylobacterium hispanicum]